MTNFFINIVTTQSTVAVELKRTQRIGWVKTTKIGIESTHTTYNKGAMAFLSLINMVWFYTNIFAPNSVVFR